MLTFAVGPCSAARSRLGSGAGCVIPVGVRGVERQEVAIAAVRQDDKSAFLTGWRRVLGVFGMTITVGTKHALLPNEERLLSILRWIELAVPVESRWYPVFRRYVEQIAQRVRFMGGDPTVIDPTPDGDWQHLGYGDGDKRQPEPEGERRTSFHGKVRALLYDRYGDFVGFVLDTEGGERRFDSREPAVERLALRASEHRIRMKVIVERDNLHHPEEIVLSGTYSCE